MMVSACHTLSFQLSSEVTGLDSLNALVQKYTADPTSYTPEEMKGCLDSFKDTLFNHLDEEVKECYIEAFVQATDAFQQVKDLSSENMKKYWTLKEVENLRT
jgi:hypothetical protein